MYELFEHTADLGLRACAASLDELFTEAARCLTAALVEEPAAIEPLVAVPITVPGEDRALVLFDWLRELLMRFESEQMLFVEFEVTVYEGGLTAVARGEVFDSTRHSLSREVKAITYHELKVEQTETGWLAEAIVDI